MAPKSNTNSLYQATLETFANPQDHNEQIIHDALENGRKVLDSRAYLGIDNLQSSYSEYLPDGSVRRVIETEHLDGSKDTQIRYLDTVHVRVLGAVNTHTEHGVETVIGVYENVPGSIDLKIGDTRSAPTDKNSAAGLVPTSWDPQHNDNSGSTSPTSDNTQQHDNTGQHDPTAVEHPVSPASGSDNTGDSSSAGTPGASVTTSVGATSGDPNATCGPGVTTYHNGPDTSHQWQDQGTSRTCTGDTQVTVEKTSPDDASAGSGSPSSASPSGETSPTSSSPSGSNDGIHDGQDGSGDPHNGDDNHDDNKGDDPKEGSPSGNPDSDMPNPEGGPGSPNSTPNPEGDDGDGSEGSHHIGSAGHGPGGSGGDGDGEGPGRLSLSENLAAGGNNQQGGSDGSFHGPHDPGEEIPNPDDAGTGGPTSHNVHGAHSFWDQAATATQGGVTGLHLSCLAVSAHGNQNQAGSNAATTVLTHDASGAPADSSADLEASARHVVAHADLYREIGTATLHDSLALHGGSFSTQMHI